MEFYQTTLQMWVQSDFGMGEFKINDEQGQAEQAILDRYAKIILPRFQHEVTDKIKNVSIKLGTNDERDSASQWFQVVVGASEELPEATADDFAWVIDSGFDVDQYGLSHDQTTLSGMITAIFEGGDVTTSMQWADGINYLDDDGLNAVVDELSTSDANWLKSQLA